MVKKATTLDIDTYPPLADEIENIIKGAVNNKAPGVDEVPAEFLKCNSNSCASPLELLLKAVWTQEKIPEDWRRGEIVTLQKKGDLGKPTNWRGMIYCLTSARSF